MVAISFIFGSLMIFLNICVLLCSSIVCCPTFHSGLYITTILISTFVKTVILFHFYSSFLFPYSTGHWIFPRKPAHPWNPTQGGDRQRTSQIPEGPVPPPQGYLLLTTHATDYFCLLLNSFYFKLWLFTIFPHPFPLPHTHKERFLGIYFLSSLKKMNLMMQFIIAIMSYSSLNLSFFWLTNGPPISFSPTLLKNPRKSLWPACPHIPPRGRCPSLPLEFSCTSPWLNKSHMY